MVHFFRSACPQEEPTDLPGKGWQSPAAWAFWRPHHGNAAPHSKQVRPPWSLRSLHWLSKENQEVGQFWDMKVFLNQIYNISFDNDYNFTTKWWKRNPFLYLSSLEAAGTPRRSSWSSSMQRVSRLWSWVRGCWYLMITGCWWMLYFYGRPNTTLCTYQSISRTRSTSGKPKLVLSCPDTRYD